MSTTALTGTLVAVLLLGVVLVIDVAGYLAAAAAAQTAADQAALAAAAVADPRGGQPGDPVAAAEAVLDGSDTVLVRCTCRSGSAPVRVEVRREVRTLLAGRLAPRTVYAVARARLVRP